MQTYLLKPGRQIIGRAGDMNETAVAVNIAKWVEDYPAGIPQLMVTTPGGQRIPLAVTVEDGLMVAVLPDTVTLGPGLYVYTAVMTNGGTQVQTARFECIILGSELAQTWKPLGPRVPDWAERIFVAADVIERAMDGAIEARTTAVDAAASATASAEAATASEGAAALSAESAAARAQEASDILDDVIDQGAAQVSAIQEAGAAALESIPETYTQLGDDVSDLKSALDLYFTLPENYDRLTDKTAESSKTFDANGDIISGNYLLFPMYIPVEPNMTYAVSVINYFGAVRGYDSDKVNVSGGVSTNAIQKTVTTGSGVYYIRISVNDNATAANVKVQKGSSPTTITSLAQLSEDVAISGNEFKPFNLDNLTGNSKLAASAFSAFEIHCADPSAQVKLTRVRRANSNVHAVVITVNGTTYYALNVLSANYTEKSYNEFNLSNVVYGYFVIDWSKLTSEVAYNSINAELKQTYVKPYVETQKYQNVEILLPSTINVAVGHEISLEFYNIIYCSSINEYEIVATPNNASFQNLGDRLRINPASAGDTTVTVSVYKNSVLIATKQTIVHAVADTQPTIKALFLGDSMTNQGIFLAELKRMLGANLNLYGTRSTTAEDSVGGTQTVLNEGRAGWSTSNYVSQASKGGITNPFYNNGFDFSYYMANNPSFADVTDVFILLGTNDGASASVMTNYTAICNSIKNYNSNIRVHCMLPIPNINSGYAWGTRNYNNWLTFKNYLFNTAKKINNEYDGAAGYYIVPVNANINCYYDFPQTQVAVNNRNPQLIAVGNDNVHPSKYGYYRFADVIYGDIVANCQ